MKKLLLCKVLRYWVSALILYPTLAYAGPWAVKPGEANLFLDYTYEKSETYFDDNGNQASDLIDGYQNFTATKSEGKIYLEAGITPHFTSIFILEGGEQVSFDASRDTLWVRFKLGGRLSIKLEEENLAISIEALYGYQHFDNQNQHQRITTTSTTEKDLLSISAELGKDWLFFDLINVYVTGSGLWRNGFSNNEVDWFQGDALLGVNLLPGLLGRRVIFVNKIFYTMSLHKRQEQRIEEYKIESSLVLFPFPDYGIEIGYRALLAGKNTNRGQGVFTRVWLSF